MYVEGKAALFTVGGAITPILVMMITTSQHMTAAVYKNK